MKYEKTSKRLREALGDNNMKPQELADLSGVSKSSISQYVNGSHKPSNLSAGKMASVLGVTPMWLMGFDSPKESSNAVSIVHTDGQSGWYLNPETARLAQEAFDNPDLRMLMDSSRDLSPEDLKILIGMAERLKGDKD